LPLPHGHPFFFVKKGIALEDLTELSLFTFHCVQIREAIGVTICIACSNMRLSRLFGHGDSLDVSGDVSMTEQTGSENWSKQLTDGATELSISIQNNISKQLESTPDSVTENGLDKKEEADVKRMETVLTLCFSPN
jgi:proteasome activator subunit 4